MKWFATMRFINSNSFLRRFYESFRRFFLGKEAGNLDIAFLNY
jgi:hypothetical protein